MSGLCHALLLLCLLAAPAAKAQFLTAEDFFHSGAQFYISNNIPAAKERVAMGRQLYPQDEKLQKLEQLLNQQSQSQSQNSQSKDQQQQQSQSDQQKNSQDQKNQQQPKSDPQSQDKQDQAKDQQKAQEEQAKKADEKKLDDQKKAEEEAAQAAKEADKQGSETNEMVDAKGAHPMTPQEAERLLNAQKGNEQYLALKPKDKPQSYKHQVKDW